MKQYILMSAAVLTLAACGGKKDNQAELAKLKQQRIELNQKISTLEETIAKESNGADNEGAKQVEVLTLEKSTFNHYIEVQGRVDGDENVTISPETPGTINVIHAHIGQPVSKGTVIAEMDNKVLQQSVADLQNSLDFSTTMFKKQENLWNQKIGSEMQYLQAKNQKEGLEKKLAGLKEQLELTKIKSPANGTLDALDLKLGQTVAPGMAVARVVNLSNLKVKAEIGESNAGLIKTGNRAIAVFPDIDDSTNTRITYASKSINPTNRTFSVEAALNSKGDFHPNMVAVLKINDYTSSSAVISIPQTTVQKTEDGNAFVMVANGNKVEKKQVKVGRVYDGTAEIVSGLEPGAKLIVKGFQDLNEGDMVKY